MIKIVNQTVPTALFKRDTITIRRTRLSATLTRPAPSRRAAVKDDHLAVFGLFFQAAKGTRSIAYMGHLRMMGRRNRLSSGAISKTVNLPRTFLSRHHEAYFRLEAWAEGCCGLSRWLQKSQRCLRLERRLPTQ